MTRWLDWLRSDWSNKLLAVVLAVAVWWMVHAKLEQTKQYTFTVQAVAAEDVEEGSAAAAQDRTLRILVPDGWHLDSPKPGTQLAFQFYGPRNKLDRFAALSPSASYRPVLPPDPGNPLDLHVQAADLQWTPADMALELLEHASPVSNELRVVLTRERTEDLALQPEMVPVVGRPAAGYELDVTGISFAPNQVRLHGPVDAVSALLEGLRTGGVDPLALLEPLQVPEGATADRVVELALSDAQAQQGLRMEPERVRVTLPVRLRERERLRFTLGPEDVLVPGHTWRLRPFAPRAWIAELRDQPGLDFSFDENWLRAHLMWYVPVPSSGGTPQAMRLEWDAYGMDAATEALLQDGLALRPESGQDADWMVELEPVPHE